MSPHSKRIISLKTVWLLLILVVATQHFYAQEPTKQEDEIDALLDELFFNEEQLIEDILDLFATKNFIYSSVRFNSATYFSGRDSGVDQFNLVPQITFFHDSGLNISASGVFYQEYDPNWDFTNLSIAYFKRLGKFEQYHFNVGYSRYIYSDSWSAFTNSVDLALGVRTKNKVLGTNVSASFLFGEDESFQLVSRTYANIMLSKKKKYLLKFKPSLSFVIAQQTIAFEQFNTGSDANEEYIYNDVFDLLNTQINLPIALITKSWDFQLGYAINLPNPLENESNLDTTGFLFLSVGYLLDL